jgi:allophanate hydrolase
MSAVEHVRAAYERIAAADRPEIWITLRPLQDALADAAAVDARVAEGEPLALAGTTLAVKDNIDVAGIDTTAGCPDYAYAPARTAPAVARLQHAGAVVVGKTNLDQFATGLVGTRSPYGAVGDARRPDHVAGGSSSGSGVAVALGLVDLALGTDTAGSGRVPAAFGGIVGLKPTRGLVPIAGVVPACRSIDCVTVFARTVGAARRAAAVMGGPYAHDGRSRTWPADAPLAAPPAPRVAVPAPAALDDLTDAARAAFAAAAQRLRETGAELVEVDVAPYLEAGRLLYEGAFVAERHAAVGAFVEAHPDRVDPTVGAIIAKAGTLSASDLGRDTERLDALAIALREALAGTDALLLPTTSSQPTIAAVQADPIAQNSRLGRYTNGTNLLDLCAIAVPAGEADGGQFGVSLLAPAFHDHVVADIAARLEGETESAADAVAAPGIDLLVIGAHLAGQPLNHQLTARGARLVASVRTAPHYRLFALDTVPPKPGLVRVEEGDADGGPVLGEVWRMPPAGLATLLAALPAPMALGRVALEDGSEVVGFLCEPIATEGARDITALGGWRAHLAVPTV